MATNVQLNTREAIQVSLFSIKRDGMNDLLQYLECSDFYEAPASTRFHGCFKGGLMVHSYLVCQMLMEKQRQYHLDVARSPGQKPLPFTMDNLVVAGLLHDVCKIGAYLKSKKPDAKAPYYWNKKQAKGHATLSLSRISQYITLEPIEELIIRYHMGVYGCREFYDEGDWQTGEYPLRGDHSKDAEMTKEASKAARYGKSLANAWYHNPICKLMYFVDELATMQSKADED